MTPFAAAATLAMLLGGAASAHATTTYATLGGTNIDPGPLATTNTASFGGFEAPGENTGQWTPSPGFSAAGFAISTDGNYYNATHEGIATTTDASTWQYIGLQNLLVQAGATVTVSAYVWEESIADGFGISYGTHNSVAVTTTPTQVYPPFADVVTYHLATFTFTASSNNIDVDFGFLVPEDSIDSGNPPIFIDAVSVTYDSVPEPASMALLGVGLLGLGMVVRRRKAG